MRNRSNDSNYHWDYQDYRGNYGQSPARARKSSGLKYFLIAMGVVILLVGALCVGASVWGSKPAPQPDQDSSIGNELEHLPEIDQQNKPEDNVPDTTEDGLLTPAGIYKKCAPSVVGIITYGSSATAQGSGIVLSENGYIITNAHVVSGGEKFEVVLQNGDSYDATVIGADNQSDLALLKMQNPPEGLVAATFGNSDELEVGEMVVAIGNPGGLALASTQTVGYISAVQRTITTELGYTMVCIQADAAINPGNSGGPLINTYGQVVGINSSKIITDGYEGMGFAIPVSKAKDIIDQLLSGGYVEGRVRLGITGSDISATQAAFYGVPRGFMIVSIDEDSAFAGTEAQPEDIITAIDGETVEELQDISNLLLRYSPGDEITVTLYRLPENSLQGDQVTVTLYRPPVNGMGEGEELEVTITLLEDKGETQR